MTRYVVDASVSVKWFVPEIDSEMASQFVGSHSELLAPDSLLLEVANILWKKTRRAELSFADGRQILRHLREAPLRLYDSRRLHELAFEIAFSAQRTVYDSLYLALALSQDCQLVTADRRLYNALRDSALSPYVRWIEEGP